MSGLADDVLQSVAVFADAVRTAPLGVLATVAPDGAAEAALVGLAVTAEGDLVLDAPREARKLVNVAHEPRVAVVVGCTGPVSLQVEGTAEVVSGTDLAACAAAYEAWHPGSRVHDPGFRVVRVRPTWLRRYDASPHPPVVSEGRPSWAVP